MVLHGAFGNIGYVKSCALKEFVCTNDFHRIGDSLDSMETGNATLCLAAVTSQGVHVRAITRQRTTGSL
jgi:hypothetical protein